MDDDKVVSLAGAKAERTFSVEDVLTLTLKDLKEDQSFKPTKTIVLMLDDTGGNYAWRFKKNLVPSDAIALMTVVREAFVLPLMGDVTAYALPPKKP